MPDYNQIEFLKNNINYIKEPIIIIGSKEYDFDNYNFKIELNKLGQNDITGIDIQDGSGVDIVLDICDDQNKYFEKYLNFYNTIICMQMLYSVDNPFKAADNIYRLMNKNSTLLFSDVFVHRIHRIPTDYWRFSYDGHKKLFHKLNFDDSRVRIGITRKNKLINFKYPLPELSKFNRNIGESLMGFISRKFIYRLNPNSLLNISRLLPEISIFSIAKKNNI